MKVSKLIDLLLEIKAKDGDIDVVISKPYYDEGGYSGQEDVELSNEHINTIDTVKFDESYTSFEKLKLLKISTDY